MVDPPTFRSWEPTWNRYAPIVYHVARALDPRASDEELAGAIANSAAHGFLDDENVDPLAALLTELLTESSARDRAIAAQVLMRFGIPDVRASTVTSIRSHIFSDVEFGGKRTPRKRFFGRFAKLQRASEKPGPIHK